MKRPVSIHVHSFSIFNASLHVRTNKINNNQVHACIGQSIDLCHHLWGGSNIYTFDPYTSLVFICHYVSWVNFLHNCQITHNPKGLTVSLLIIVKDLADLDVDAL